MGLPMNDELMEIWIVVLKIFPYFVPCHLFHLSPLYPIAEVQQISNIAIKYISEVDN